MNQLSSPSVKRAIIMGATSGIGYETARLLLAEGWHLGIAGRREKELQILASSSSRTCSGPALLISACRMQEKNFFSLSMIWEEWIYISIVRVLVIKTLP